MKIQLERGNGQYVIRSHQPGRIVVNQEAHTVSLIVTPERIMPDWRPQRFEDLAAEDFETIRALRPEVVLLGTGARLRFPTPALTQPLVAAQIGFEVMDTGAACRTYNVLMGEGRLVAAALLIESG